MAWPQLAIGQAPKDLKYRFQWNAPILISPPRPEDALPRAPRCCCVSRDEGQSWEEISPDLTRNDKSKQEQVRAARSRKDDTGVEVYDTIFASPSRPLDPGVLWAGTDDGLVHVTRDGGKNWENVTPKGLPEWIQINSIEASPHDPASALRRGHDVQARRLPAVPLQDARLRQDLDEDRRRHPRSSFTRVVREDPVRKGLLYAGTEYGLYVSFDDGASWQPFQRNLPVVPITDLAVKEGDLVVATQGRSFWILDDLTPLRDYRSDLRGERFHVFPPRPSYRFRTGGGGGDDEESGPTNEGKNPPGGVLVSYWLHDKPGEKETLTIEIAEGDSVLRTYTSEKKDKDKEKDGEGEEADPRADKPLEPKAGLNRFVWDMRILRPALLPKAVIWGDDSGPLVAPGTYTVRVKLGDETRTQKFEVVPRPGIAATPEDLKQQYDLLRNTSDGLAATHEAVEQIRDVKAQIQTVTKHAEELGKGAAVKDKGKALSDRLTSIEKKLVNPDVKSSQDVLNFTPALDHQFAGLAGVVVERRRETDGLLGRVLPADPGAARRDPGGAEGACSTATWPRSTRPSAPPTSPRSSCPPRRRPRIPSPPERGRGVG